MDTGDGSVDINITLATLADLKKCREITGRDEPVTVCIACTTAQTGRERSSAAARREHVAWIERASSGVALGAGHTLLQRSGSTLGAQ